MRLAKIGKNTGAICFYPIRFNLKSIGIYTSPAAPSPKGEGWDEGNVNA
jgi:hypothetical protein